MTAAPAVPVVFLGPSLPLEAARQHLDALYLPPVRQGCLWQLLVVGRPAAIGIIDGAFENVPAVWHKEILWALAEGIPVVGAASMGAMRAAELAAFGMVGLGRIFEAYRCGHLAPYAEPFEDDDEVAVVHGPAESGFIASEALVNMRVTLARASEDGVIDAPARDALIALAKATFYKERSWDGLLRRAAGAVAPAVLSRLGAWLDGGRVDQKREDARALLDWLRDNPAHRPDTRFRFERTTVWEDGLAQLFAAEDDGDEAEVAALVDLAALKALAPKDALRRLHAAWRHHHGAGVQNASGDGHGEGPYAERPFRGGPSGGRVAPPC